MTAIPASDVRPFEYELVTQRLRQLRFAGHLTQVALAEKSGVGIKTISSYESGARIGSLRLEYMIAITRALRVPLVELFEFEDTRGIRAGQQKVEKRFWAK